MLTSLSIKNYALIDNLHVNFNQGFSIITGETGAGKSILLGGLSLILGKRADLNSLTTDVGSALFTKNENGIVDITTSKSIVSANGIILEQNI